MNQLTCTNHPDRPADALGDDYGPPLCDECSATWELPATRIADRRDNDRGYLASVHATLPSARRQTTSGSALVIAEGERETAIEVGANAIAMSVNDWEPDDGAYDLATAVIDGLITAGRAAGAAPGVEPSRASGWCGARGTVWPVDTGGCSVNGHSGVLNSSRSEGARRPSQAEVGAWLVRNFGATRSVTEQALVLTEEVGELCRAIVKRAQGIRGTAEEWTAEVRKELADVQLVLLALAECEGIDLDQAAAEKWAVVSGRDARAELLPRSSGEPVTWTEASERPHAAHARGAPIEELERLAGEELDAPLAQDEVAHT